MVNIFITINAKLKSAIVRMSCAYNCSGKDENRLPCGPYNFLENFRMLIEENLPLATTEELQELLVHMEHLYNCHKKLRDSYASLHPMTKFIMDNFSLNEEGVVKSHIEELIQTLGYGVSSYSRDVELIKEELERRNVILSEDSDPDYEVFQ